MAVTRSEIESAMRNAGFDPDDTTSATSPKYNARLFETIAGLIKTEMAGSIDWSTLTEYETAGTRSVRVPDNCNKAFIFEMVAGGGGACGPQTRNTTLCFGGTPPSLLPGNPGEPGQRVRNKIVNVTPNSNISIVVGRGGASSRTNDANGIAGGSTSFGSILSVSGGATGSGATTFAVADNRSYKYLFMNVRDRTAIGYGVDKTLFSRGCAGQGGFTGGASISNLAANDITDGRDGYILFAFIRKA